MYCFGHSSSQSVLQWNSFSPLKYIVYKCFSCFRPRMGHFFSSSYLTTLVTLFLLLHQKIFVPYIVLYTACLSLITQWNCISPSKYICYKCYICIIPGFGQFFSSSHLSRFFCCIVRNYLSHVLFWSQLVSVCFAMKFFFSFKIHCLQKFQLFQTKDGPIFFIVTLVYICRAFFAVSSENIYPIYCFGHSSSQSVWQWNSFSPLKYIIYKCFSCFRPGTGHFFSSSHLSTLVTLFFAASSEIICPIYIWLHHEDFWRENFSISLYNILYLSI